MFQTVITILEKELKLYRELYDLVKRQTTIIKDGDINVLNELLKQQQKYVTTMSVLEEERQQELARMFPEKSPLPTIRECIEIAPEDEKTRLRKLHHELTEVLTDVRETNELNQQLLEQSLEFVNFSINLLRPQQENINYGPPQKKQPAQGTSSIFNKEV